MNPYLNVYNPQASVDRINSQIAELEKMKAQIPMQQPTNLTQNFQIATPNTTMKYAESIDEVRKDMVICETPYFSKDMSVLWLKNTTGEIKTYNLEEIIEKDEKDVQIEILQARIKELEAIKNEPSIEYVNEPIENEKPSSFQAIRGNKKK